MCAEMYGGFVVLTDDIVGVLLSAHRVNHTAWSGYDESVVIDV